MIIIISLLVRLFSVFRVESLSRYQLGLSEVRLSGNLESFLIRTI